MGNDASLEKVRQIPTGILVSVHLLGATTVEEVKVLFSWNLHAHDLVTELAD